MSKWVNKHLYIYSNEYLSMENLYQLNAVQQGSEASSEYTERFAQAVQHEAENLVEPEHDGAPVALKWLDSKNKQMNEFLNKLEQEGMQRSKFKVLSWVPLNLCASTFLQWFAPWVPLDT